MSDTHVNYIRGVILGEAEKRGMGNVAVSKAVIEHMKDLHKAHGRRKNPPRICTNPETVMRFLRGETEGGAYIIDACLAVLKLRVRKGKVEPVKS